MGEVGTRHAARARRGGQGAAGVILERRRPPAPLRAGSARSFGPKSPKHLDRPRSRRTRRFAVRGLRAPGGRDASRVLSGGKLSPRHTIDYALQIVHGLAAAHEKGIVHRDLKPENLFVTRRSRQDPRLRPGQADAAKCSNREETSAPTATLGTEPGVVLGTVGYMSPEQVRGKPADARSDIFSLGVVFYELLSGRRAFRGDSAIDRKRPESLIRTPPYGSSDAQFAMIWMPGCRALPARSRNRPSGPTS
jgi:serine/threonine protein kinase